MILELDRTKAPEAYDLKKTNLLEAVKINVDGYNLYVVKGGSDEVFKLEFIFTQGNRTEKQKLVANACNFLINSGTNKYSSKEIMEKIDYYGAFFQSENSFDRSNVAVYSLNKYHKEIFEIVFEIMSHANFPESEIEIYKTNAKQRFIINSNKNEFLARKAFNYALFSEHPYGYKIHAEDFDHLNRDVIVEHFQNNYNLKNSHIILSGNITDEILNDLISYLNSYTSAENQKPTTYAKLLPYHQSVYFEERKDALQSAIRIGKQIINKTHADFMELSILTTVLGGYFGSRLMANIREDKGYTYGIGAGIYSLLDTGFFYIATEVGADVCGNAIEEIYKEINRLNNELIPEEELAVVKNYLKGNYINSIENIFSHADKFKGIHLYDLDYSYYDRYFEVIDKINPERLMELSNQYLALNSLSEVVIGKK